MALDREQRKTAVVFGQRARRKKATKREAKALFEAGLTEASLRNPAGGDRDSVGSLQERGHYGSVKRRLNRAAAADRFLDEAKQFRGKNMSAGSLAQAVQRSAFPARYDQRSGEAAQLMAQYVKAYGSGDGGSDPLKVKMTPDKLVTGHQKVFDTKAFKAQQGLFMLGQLQQRHGRGGVLRRLGVIPTTEPVAKDFTKLEPWSAVKKGELSITGGGGRGSGESTSAATGAKGTATFEGMRVAAWIKPELEYARKHGWKGKVNSGFRSRAEQTRIYNSGVRPAARPGTSNHEGADFPRGAVDVSDPQTLDRILRRKRSPLKFAGAKDPVHFSHPHGGSY